MTTRITAGALSLALLLGAGVSFASPLPEPVPSRKVRALADLLVAHPQFKGTVCNRIVLQFPDWTDPVWDKGVFCSRYAQRPPVRSPVSVIYGWKDLERTDFRIKVVADIAFLIFKPFAPEDRSLEDLWAAGAVYSTQELADALTLAKSSG